MPTRQTLKPLATERYAFRAALVERKAEGAQVSVCVSRANIGAPLREGLQREWLVAPQQWTQLHWNGRFTDVDTGAWWYEQTTLNVACFAEAMNGGIFTTRAPDLKFDFRAILR